MNDSENNYLLTICQVSQLGELMKNPVQVTGGLMHKMFKIETDQGKFAIKWLNPYIMERSDALQNFIRSEEIASLASRQIPALPALRVSAQSIQQVDGQYFLIFDWVEGTSLKQYEITAKHSYEIGVILGKIHQMNFSRQLSSQDTCMEEVNRLDWEGYIALGIEKQAGWLQMLVDLKDILIDLNEAAVRASNSLSSELVFSHRDLDSKNVLWNSIGPTIIDWESAGSIHPMQDLVETMIYWSRDEQGKDNQKRFNAFLDGYKQIHPQLQADWQSVLSVSHWSKLKWLAYNLKRSVGIDYIDSDDQLIGMEQVKSTLHELTGELSNTPRLHQWITEHGDANKGEDSIS